MSILPSQTKCIAFYFKPSWPGSYHLVVGIESFPSIPQKHIQLQAICLVKDEDKIHRDRLLQAIEEDRIAQDAAEIVRYMIDNIVEVDPAMQNLPKSFCQRNRDHKVNYIVFIPEKNI